MAPIVFWAQGPVATVQKGKVFAFYDYQIKNGLGMREAFDAGYGRDLEWHRAQGDQWAWIGWYVINGERRDWFIDASPDHQWSDFDSWNISGAENSRLNKIHWTPYVEDAQGSYRTVLSEFSNEREDWYRSKFLQVHHLEVSPLQEKDFLAFLKNFRPFLESLLGETAFVWMKTDSGGAAHGYLLLIAVDQLVQMERVSGIFDPKLLPDKLWDQYSGTVARNVSEMWRYVPSLSLYPGDNRSPANKW